MINLYQKKPFIPESWNIMNLRNSIPQKVNID
jgi:hypothetical protein